MTKHARTFLIFAVIFGMFLFAVCETQITPTTGIIDRDRLFTFRLKNASTGVLSVFGHKTYIDADSLRAAGDVAAAVADVATIFAPTLIMEAVSRSAEDYFAIFADLKSLFSESRNFSEPQNAENF